MFDFSSPKKTTSPTHFPNKTFNKKNNNAMNNNKHNKHNKHNNRINNKINQYTIINQSVTIVKSKNKEGVSNFSGNVRTKL